MKNNVGKINSPRQAKRRSTSWITAGLLLGLAILPRAAQAADAETRAFNAAAKAFQDGFTGRAQQEFAAFVRTYTNSSRLPDAILTQARAAFSQTNYSAAISLLTTNLPHAGSLADQYHFWIGQMRLESGNYQAAANEFARLLTAYTNSPRRLEASYGEALARFNLQDWPRVVQLLRQPEGAFRRAAREDGDSDLIGRGQLLLAETLFKQQDYLGAESAAERISTSSPRIAWARQFLRCRIQIATDHSTNALQSTTNLLSLAAATGQSTLQAESYALQGTILEDLHQYDDAISAYERIQAPTMPDEQRRQAFLKIVELTLAQDNLALATEKLDKFLAAHPEDEASDEVLLTLGELRLKEHLEVRPVTASATNGVTAPVTNRLQQAIGYFEQLVQRYPQSPYIGKANLDRGWALLSAQKWVEAQAAFKLAAEKLPFSEEQAIARFKLADTQFMQGDYTNALAGYRQIFEDYNALPRIRTELFDRAWYQIARIYMKLGQLAKANEAIRTILAEYPASLYGQRMLLLFGQELNRSNRVAEARGVLAEFTRQFTNSVLLPEAELAIGRSYELEGNWAAAIRTYDGLLSRCGTNDMAPKVEFRLALAHDHAGHETNAFNLLTNLLARFPTNELAPRAEDWIGDYYYRNADYVEAERSYQWTNWPPGDPIIFQATFKAGRAALMRPTGFDDAINYFLKLINDKGCPDALVAETLFAYGDALISKGQLPGNTNALAQYETAVEAFRKIPQLYPSSPLVPHAWGRMGDCYFQMAGRDPRRYTNAVECYEKAMSAPNADLATRSQAEIGLGNTLVKQAELKAPPDLDLMKSARDHYLNIVYGKNLHEAEAPIPIWVKEAGLAAAKILETQQQWTQAINLYTHLQQLLPALRSSLEKRAASARGQLTAQRD